MPLFIQDVISLVLGVMGDFLLHPSRSVYYVRRSRFSRTFHLGRKSPFLDLDGVGAGTWSAFVGSGSIRSLLFRVPMSFQSDTLMW